MGSPIPPHLGNQGLETQMSYSLSTIRNFRNCHVGWPRALEEDAIWEVITEGWSYAEVEATAKQGVADVDADAIYQLITDEELRIEPEDAIQSLLERCRKMVKSQE
jgi:hypothetical protein